MNPFFLIILIMALSLVILVLKPEIGMQFKAFTEKFAFDAEWKPSKDTRWRFVIVGVFIELLFIALVILMLLNK
jgi:hypothetical protein